MQGTGAEGGLAKANRGLGSADLSEVPRSAPQVRMRARTSSSGLLAKGFYGEGSTHWVGKEATHGSFFRNRVPCCLATSCFKDSYGREGAGVKLARLVRPHKQETFMASSWEAGRQAAQSG
jgi:hypothetical protein